MVLVVGRCRYVCVSHKSLFEMDGSIDLVFGIVVFSGLSYTVLEENLGTSKINVLLSGILLANSGR